MARLDCMNVYADGTACINSPVSSNRDLGMPSEFTEDENEASFHQYLCDIAPPVQVPQMPLRLPLSVNDVYADGTACTGNGTKNLDNGIQSEFMESEREALFHEYLSDIAPVVVSRLHVGNVYADGTACIGDSPKNIDNLIPREFDDSEDEAMFHEYLSDIAPPEVVTFSSPGALEVNDVYADGTACPGGSPKRIDSSLPFEFDESEREACLHEYLSDIAPVVVSRLHVGNVYADGTACTGDSPKYSNSLIPCEFCESEDEAMFHEYLSEIAPPVVPQTSTMTLDVINVFADGTVCPGSSPKSEDNRIPHEFIEPEKEASLHEYLSDIAPPVAVSQSPLMPLDVNNVYADGTACTGSSPKNVDSSVPREFIEPEKEASFHEYLCDIAPVVTVAEPCSPKRFDSTYGGYTADNIMEESPPDQLLGA